jgi:hypothetical protein
MDTHSVTTSVLATHLGSPPQYGETAAAVLETCALVASADEQWDPKQITRFQDQVGIHEKVWGRLLAIHHCTRWQEVEQSKLPGNYTALYAITTLSDEAWKQLVERKVLSRTLSSRHILTWEAQVKTGLSELPRRLGMVLACSEGQIDELKAVAQQFKEIAQAHGMFLGFKSSTSRGISAGSTPEQVMDAISERLIPLLKEPLNEAGKVLKDALGIQSEEDLICLTVRDFSKFINRTAGSARSALETYGKQYCLKLALEYNRASNTRANRFNYKKKLEEFVSGDPDAEIATLAKQVISDFIE